VYDQRNSKLDKLKKDLNAVGSDINNSCLLTVPVS